MKRSRNSGKVNGRPSAALSGRGARVGPQPARRRGGAGGPRPSRARGRVLAEARARPPPGRHRRLGPRRLRPQHISRVRHAPSLGAGRGRAACPRGPEGGTSGGGPGDWAPGRSLGIEPGHCQGERPPRGGRREARGRGAGPVVKGGACCWGWRRKRGEGAGPTGCLFGLLVYSWRGSFNPKGGRERGKTRSRIFKRLAQEWAEGGNRREGAKAAAFLERSSYRRSGQFLLVFWCVFKIS